MDQNKAIKFLYNLSSKLNKFYKSNSKKKLIINNKSKRKKTFNPVTNFDKNFEKMIRAYLLKRQQLACVFILIDSRIPPQKSDLDFIKIDLGVLIEYFLYKSLP